MHKSLLNQQKDVVHPWPCIWCFAELGLGDKCCDSSFHSCTTCIKTAIWRGRTGICERSLLCNPYDKEELSIAYIFPGNSSGASIHLSCASHVSSVQALRQRHKLPYVVFRAAGSFGCPGFLPLRTQMFQSPTCNICRCLYRAANCLHQVGVYLLPQMTLSGFGSPSKRSAFQPKTSKTSGYKDVVV